MRERARLVALVALTACSSRTADYPVDYTEEVERICDNVCEKAATCEDPPYIEYDACIAVCNGPGAMLDDTVCGDAFRALFKCIGDTETCEQYLDTRNAYAEDYTCKEENLAIVPLECGAQEGVD